VPEAAEDVVGPGVAGPDSDSHETAVDVTAGVPGNVADVTAGTHSRHFPSRFRQSEWKCCSRLLFAFLCHCSLRGAKGVLYPPVAAADESGERPSA
jgi:hypothetical protein